MAANSPTPGPRSNVDRPLPSGLPIAQPLETFSYSYRDLVWRYTRNGQQNDWRYRYSASGEREQKRLYPLDTNDHLTSHGNPWAYYLLGGGKEQLAVWHGQERWDPTAPGCPVGRVLMYPVEYNTYAGGLGRITTRPQPTGTVPVKEFHISDHLGSVRVAMDSLVRGVTTDYEPFGALAYTTSFGRQAPRQSYIDKERDGENGLGDFGVRKYEAETGRFMSVDGLWELFPAISPYAYSQADPVRLRDRDGRRGESYHIDVIRGAFEGIATEAEIEVMIDATRLQDTKQEPDEQHMHSMRSEGESVADATRKRDAFRADRLSDFVEAGDLAAFEEYNHTFVDENTPEHANLATWPTLDFPYVDALLGWAAHSVGEALNANADEDIAATKARFQEALQLRQTYLQGLEQGKGDDREDDPQ